MVAHAEVSDLIFTPTGNKVWTAVMDSESISIKMLPDAIKIFYDKRSIFGDLHEALQYITNLTGRRPLFTLDEYTANAKPKCG